MVSKTRGQAWRAATSDGHAVEVLDVPGVRPGGVAVHKYGFFNEAPSLALTEGFTYHAAILLTW